MDPRGLAAGRPVNRERFPAGGRRHLTVNGKVVARPCTVSTVNATVELGDLYTFSLIGAGSASAWHSVALDLSNCPVGTSRVTATFSGTADSTGYYKTRERRAIFSSNCRARTAPR
jgi:type 1 fimbria pilin